MKELFKFLISRKNLSKKHKYFTIVIIFFTFLSFFAELFSIGLIIPLVSVMFNKEKIENFEFLIPDFIESKNLDHTEFIYIFLGLIFLAYFFKTIVLFFHNYLVARYCASLGLFIQSKLINKYLEKSIDFYNSINSSILVRNLSSEITVFVNHVLVPFFIIIIEFLVLVGILLLVLYFELKTGLFVLIVGLLSALLVKKFLSSRLTTWGKERQKYSAESLKKINDLFFSQKIIKILQKENFFFSRLYNSLYRLTHTQLKKRIIAPVPRLAIEILAIISFCLLIVFMLNDNKQTNEIITILALYAAAAFRLIPSFNRITEMYNQFKFSIPSLSVIDNELNSQDYDYKISRKLNQKQEDFQKIEINNLSFSYDKKIILKDINFKLEKKDMVGIVGKSGSGKTTLVNVLLGFHNIDASIKYNSNIVKDIRAWISQVGYVPQDTYLLDDSIKNNIAFGLSDNEIDQTILDEAIEQSQLKSFINSLKEGVNTIIGENGVKLSGGQRQRLGIARALYTKPEILIFDEATSSLDMETENDFVEAILKFKSKKTVLIITHRPSLLRTCDKIFKLENGQLKLNEK